jgi:hypothetical protein
MQTWLIKPRKQIAIDLGQIKPNNSAGFEGVLCWENTNRKPQQRENQNKFCVHKE